MIIPLHIFILFLSISNLLNIVRFFFLNLGNQFSVLGSIFFKASVANPWGLSLFFMNVLASSVLHYFCFSAWSCSVILLICFEEVIAYSSSSLVPIILDQSTRVSETMVNKQIEKCVFRECSITGARPWLPLSWDALKEPLSSSLSGGKRLSASLPVDWIIQSVSAWYLLNLNHSRTEGCLHRLSKWIVQKYFLNLPWNTPISLYDVEEW